MYADVARKTGEETLIDPTTAPAWSRIAAPRQITPKLKLFPIDRKTVSAREPQIFLQLLNVGDGVRRKRGEAFVRDDPIKFGGR